METLTRRIDLRRAEDETTMRQVLRREWLLANGVGGYASGTISGTVTRRYHGYLIAALPSPFGRTVMLNHLSEFIRFPDGHLVQIGGEEPTRPEEGKPGVLYLTEFRLENQLPVWRYAVEGIQIEKRVVLLYGQNTVHVHYSLLTREDGVEMALRPAVHFRQHEHSVSEPLKGDYLLKILADQYEICWGGDLPPLRLMIHGDPVSFLHDLDSRREIAYLAEADRGYESLGELWIPGTFSFSLPAGKPVTLIASTEPWSTIKAIKPEEALFWERARRRRLISSANPHLQDPPVAELVLAADQFIITPAGRIEDTARAHAMGDQVSTIIAGYHWFTDWGRDTMISLEGLTLTTGRELEAGWILRTFAHYIKHGLIPNMFPEGNNEGLYHTADATLWFFHALDRYLEATNDRKTLQSILPQLMEIADYHLRGTRFGIGVDSRDGLLRQGQEGYQLTWMDAKVEDWVVTPRRGKTVEINALWYNALRLLINWVTEEIDANAARPLKEQADRVYEAFNKRFWYEDGGYLYDLIDGEEGNDFACRPNQIFAISLKYPVLEEGYWKPVLKVVHDKLYTPVGLRSLSQDHPDYKSKYFGNLRARDAAYHQGTVWGWLMGPFVDAWLKVHPKERVEARRFLQGFLPHLDEACVGSISEIFDAEPPFLPSGCIAQAWSVAEFLRVWVKTAKE